MKNDYPVQKMPKSVFPNNSPPVSKHWRSGAVPIRETGETLYAREKRRTASAEEGFAAWWREVRESGVLLPPEAEEDIDYFGEMPWPKLVSARTLYAAYVAIASKTNEVYSPKNFRSALIRYTDIRYYTTMNVKIPTSKRGRKRMEAFYATVKR